MGDIFRDLTKLQENTTLLLLDLSLEDKIRCLFRQPAKLLHLPYLIRNRSNKHSGSGISFTETTVVTLNLQKMQLFFNGSVCSNSYHFEVLLVQIANNHLALQQVVIVFFQYLKRSGSPLMILDALDIGGILWLPITQQLCDHPSVYKQ
ncbi:hypothetical protein AVEN_193762-1 [Araneus ventricosus]|uniref:Uncharacterized protein n=1 Tax=Araneus ventricosus TaxID=182803 RepID=A0A4Y2DMP4_ARAVE|nr:hypothetical protein AVEN_193762-1 [Araneus ventricosus]